MNISVVIPTFNREKTIIRCLKSVLEQSHLPFEILVVDDGSTDNTIALVKQLGGKIKVIEQKHQGAQAARNCGIKEAKGDYIAFLDSDDVWLPKKLELQVKALRDNPKAVITCNGYIQNENSVCDMNLAKNGEFYKDIGQVTLAAGVGNGNVYRKALSGKSALFQGMVCPKEALIKIGGVDEKVPSFQEWDTTIMLAKDNRFVHLRDCLFIYYLHEGETISKDPFKGIAGREYIIEKHKNEIVEELGWQAVQRHYKDILMKCVLYDSSKYNKYYLKWILAGLHRGYQI